MGRVRSFGQNGPGSKRYCKNRTPLSGTVHFPILSPGPISFYLEHFVGFGNAWETLFGSEDFLHTGGGHLATTS